LFLFVIQLKRLILGEDKQSQHKC